MDHDEDFARLLRDRLDDIAPRIDVDTTRVVPRARRHRTRVRSVGAVAVVAALAGGGWLVDSAPWGGAALAPASSTTATPTGDPSPLSTPTDEQTDAVTAQRTAAEAAADAAAAADAGWWYVRAQYLQSGQVGTLETWSSRTLPGLIVDDGDLTTASGKGPSTVIGRFRIDGVWVDQLRDVNRLPTDTTALEAVLRASVEPDRRSGSDDDKVFGMARDLLLEAGLQPVALRHAAWGVLSGVPGATASLGTDSLDRPGEVVEYTTAAGEAQRLVRDPATGLLLEESTGAGWSQVYLAQRTVTSLPVEPTLENSGCTAWATC
ncbi:hypothetical protein ACTHAM_001904 [Cellulomonas soli]|uniref:hypothetical protein n=1 Tax=Cellulomonas soli TaxID=931535 RepID=UPI003F839F58